MTNAIPEPTFKQKCRVFKSSLFFRTVMSLASLTAIFGIDLLMVYYSSTMRNAIDAVVIILMVLFLCEAFVLMSIASVHVELALFSLRFIAVVALIFNLSVIGPWLYSNVATTISRSCILGFEISISILLPEYKISQHHSVVQKVVATRLILVIIFALVIPPLTNPKMYFGDYPNLTGAMESLMESCTTDGMTYML